MTHITRGFKASLFCILLTVCAGKAFSAPQAEPANPQPLPAETIPQAERPASTAEILSEVRRLLETGTPTSLQAAQSLIAERGLAQSEYGRAMNALASLIIDKIYPDAGLEHTERDPPLNHTYTKIIADVEKGVWMPPPSDSKDYLVNVLPCLVLANNQLGAAPSAATPSAMTLALSFLQKARSLNPNGVLAVYLSALIKEREQKLLDARTNYEEAVKLSGGECYPAYLGIARLLSRAGKRDDAVLMLLDLSRLYPTNTAARRQLTTIYIAEQDWKSAEAEITAVLSKNYRNLEFLLLQARVFVELGRYNEARLPLQTYAEVSAGGAPSNRDYRLLSARIEWEGNRNRSAAITHLRPAVAANPSDAECASYLARLLLGSSQPANKEEGRALLSRLLEQKTAGRDILRLAFEDAVSRSAWTEADAYLSKLLDGALTLSDLKNAAAVKKGLGDTEGAIQFARRAAQDFPAEESAALDLIKALSESESRGNRAEASRLIETALTANFSAEGRGRLYFYRGRLRPNDGDAIADFRQSLLETPRNLDALLALIAVYDKQGDRRRASFYLQQALLLAPDNPELLRLRNLFDRG